MYSVKTTTAEVSVGIYARLSEEDIDKYGHIDSQSISNQKGMLTRYCEERGWHIYGVYSDDGISGLECDRPDFNRLLRDCEKGLVNTVIVKEQSRFCRNTSLVNEVLKELFPTLGIHFIAVTTGLDSNDPDYLNRIGLNGYIDESFIEQTSKRVTSVFAYKRAMGQCISPFAPYGYVKDPQDKHHLVIDPETAPIVRRIFEEYVSGYGFGKIARGLNNDGIIPPYEYKKQNGSNYTLSRAGKGVWRDTTIRTMVVNEVYIGTLAQGRRKKINYRVKKSVPVPSEEWQRTYNAHEPIISQELWDKAQARKQERYRAGSKSQEVYCLAGKCICGVCGTVMTKHKTYGKYVSGPNKGQKNGVIYESMVCCDRNHGNTNCDNTKGIRCGIVIEECLTAIRQAIKAYADSDMVHIEDMHEERLRDLRGQLQQQYIKADKIQCRLDNLYTDKLDGLITVDEYVRYKADFTAQLNECRGIIAKIEQSIKSLTDSMTDTLNRQQLIEQYSTIEEFNRDVAETFIDRVVVGKVDEQGDRELKVVLKI